MRKIKQLEQDLKELTNIVKNEEYKTFKRDSESLKKTRELLDLIKIKVKDVRIVLDQEKLENCVEIRYEIPKISIFFDENGDPIKNEMFYAINALNLISLEDMGRIKKEFDTIKNKN